MPTMFIANCTQQNQVVNFRLPESKKVHSYAIPMGKQVPIGGRAGLTQPEFDAVLAALKPYGLLGLNKLGGMQGKIPFIYSESPIRAEVILTVLNHNRGFLKEGGQKRRQMAAIAANQQIDAMAEASGVEPVRAFEMSVEENNQGSFSGGEDKPIAEGVRVATEPGQPKPHRKGRSR